MDATGQRMFRRSNIRLRRKYISCTAIVALSNLRTFLQRDTITGRAKGSLCIHSSPGTLSLTSGRLSIQVEKSTRALFQLFSERIWNISNQVRLILLQRVTVSIKCFSLARRVASIDEPADHTHHVEHLWCGLPRAVESVCRHTLRQGD